MNTLRMFDSGAPRGERRWWHVELNGVTVYESTNRAAVRGVYLALCKALKLPPDER